MFRQVKDSLLSLTQTAADFMSEIQLHDYNEEIDFDDNQVFYDGVNYDLHVAPDSILYPLKGKLTPRKVGSLPHDSVLVQLTNILEDDPTFNSVFGPMEDGFDNGSPDIIYKIDGLWNVCEVGTTKSGNLSTAYEKKSRKYQDAVKRRTTGKFLVVIVGATGVCSNSSIDGITLRNLVKAYRMGLSIVEKCKSLGWKDADDEEEYRRASLLSSLRSMCDADSTTISDRRIKEPLIIDHSMKTRFLMSKPPIYTSLLDRTEELTLKKMHHTPSNEKYQKYLDSIDSKETRNDYKTIVQMPGLIFNSDLGENFDDYFEDVIAGEYSPEGQLWSSVLDSEKNQFFPLSEDYDDYKEIRQTIKESIDSTNKNKINIREHNRILVHLDEKLNRELSLSGLGGKRFREEASNKEKMRISRLGYSSNASTDDIERFCNDKSLVERSLHPTIEMHRLETFLDYAKEMKKDYALSILNDFCRTKFGHVCSFQSALAAELNLNIRKPTKKNEYILIKMRSYPAWILLHNTGSAKHSFYTILVPKSCLSETMTSIFTPLTQTSHYVMSSIRSTRESDLSSQLGIFAKQFAKISLLYQVWNQEYDSNLQEADFLPELLSTYLIEMENKENTSSAIMNFRYMYMEMVCKDRACDPFKVMSKFPEIIRSRLLLWFVKNAGIAFDTKNYAPNRINKTPDFHDSKEEGDSVNEHQWEEFAPKEVDLDNEEDISDDNIQLISVCSRKKLPSFEAALCLSYLGVYHNKDKSEDIHGRLKMFNKIIVQELLMRETRPEYTGIKLPERDIDPTKLRTHEFSVHHTTSIGLQLRKYLNKIRPDLIEKIIWDVLHVSFEDLATFKASADSSQFSEMSLEFKDHVTKKRPKTLEEILRILKEMNPLDECPFTMSDKLLEKLKSHGGIRVNLFKKNQKTGVREIFVLIMYARIMIRLLETISRSICDVVPHEYLTKGKKKSAAITNHYSKAGKIKRSCPKMMTVTDSLDMTTWAQKFIMPIFSSFFCGFFDTSNEIENTLYDSINVILNLMTEKQLELPHDLLQLFITHEDVESMSCPAMNDLKDQFLGRSEHNDLINKGEVLMKNRSNMMQGILHYTSSLLHSGHLYWHKVYVESMIRTYIPEARIYTTIMCSSDDAGRLLTLGAPASVDYSVIRSVLRWSSNLLEASYPFIGVEMSKAKSTDIVMSDVIEFNSNWNYKNTQLGTLIKWSAASMEYKLSTSAIDRQLMDHNLLEDMMKGGSTTLTTSVHEIACAINHYDCLGLYTSSAVFYRNLLLDIHRHKNPVMWCYLLSHHSIGTALGYKFTRYWNLVNFSEARRSEMITRKHIIGDTTDSGEFNIHAKLTHGDNRKYLDFLKRIECPSVSELVETALKEPSKMFERARSVPDVITNIYLKARSFGAEKNFCFETASKQHASSAYIAKSAVIRVYDNDGNVVKMSLPTLLNEFNLQLLTGSEYQINMTDFPMMELYSDVTSYFRTLYPRRYHHKKRRINVSVTIPRDELNVECSLMDCVRHNWFRLPTKNSRFIIESATKKYMSVLPWFKHDFNSSLNEFSELYTGTNALQFIDFVKNYDVKPLKIEMSHRGRVKSGVFDMLTHMISYQYSPNHILMRRRVNEKRRVLWEEKLGTIDRKLYHLQSCFNDQKLRIEAVEKIMETVSDISMNDIKSIPRKYKPLALICWIWHESEFYSREAHKVLSEDKSYMLSSMIKQLKKGTLVQYVQEQQKIESSDGTKWVGNAIMNVLINNLRMRVYIKDDTLTRVEVSSLSLAAEYKNEIDKLFAEKIRVRHTDSLRTSPYEYSFSEVSDGTVMMCKTKSGLPIYEVKNLPTISGNMKIGIHLSTKNILTAELMVRDFSIGVLNYFPKLTKSSKDISLNCVRSDNVMNHCFSSWINNRESSYSAICLMFDQYPDHREWMKSTFLSRLSHRSMLPDFDKHEQARQIYVDMIAHYERTGQIKNQNELSDNRVSDDDVGFLTSAFQDAMNYMNGTEMTKFNSAMDEVARTDVELCIDGQEEETEYERIGRIASEAKEFFRIESSHTMKTAAGEMQKNLSAFDVQSNVFWDKFIDEFSKFAHREVAFRDWKFIPESMIHDLKPHVIIAVEFMKYCGWTEKPMETTYYGDVIDPTEEMFKNTLQQRVMIREMEERKKSVSFADDIVNKISSRSQSPKSESSADSVPVSNIQLDSGMSSMLCALRADDSSDDDSYSDFSDIDDQDASADDDLTVPPLDLPDYYDSVRNAMS